MTDFGCDCIEGPIALVGFMGSGKTTVGRRLASQIAWPLVDLDAWIESRLGATVAEIFDRQGEEAFRRAEEEALIEVLDQRCVLATGGGVVESASNRRRLSERARVVWLDARDPVLWRRLEGSEATRPLLSGRDGEALRALHRRRRMLYAAVAHWRLETDRELPGPLARRIAAMVTASPS